MAAAASLSSRRRECGDVSEANIPVSCSSSSRFRARQKGAWIAGRFRAWCRVGVADARSDGYIDRRARCRPTEATPVPCPPGTNSDTPEVGSEKTAEGALPAGGEIAKCDPPRRPSNGSGSTGSSAAKRGTELSNGGCVARGSRAPAASTIALGEDQLAAASWGAWAFIVTRNDHLEPACAPDGTPEGAALLLGEGSAKATQIAEQADLCRIAPRDSRAP